MSRARKMLKNLEEMSRGRVIVDENLKGLAPELSKRNFNVKSPRAGMADEGIVDLMLSKGDILITDDATSFILSALSHGFNIISCEGVVKDPKDLARLVDSVMRDYELWIMAKKKSPWIFTLGKDGNHSFRKNK